MRGKRSLLRHLPKSVRDHPRACGENFFLSVYVIGLSGSPPRMRGKLDFEFRRQLIDGITPAHAGKTSKER